MKPLDLHTEELQRIRREYTRRAREIPADYYSLKYPWNLFTYAQRMRAVIGALDRNGFFPLNDKEVLEIGYGHGDWLVDLQKWGAGQNHLHGIELDAVRARVAKDRLPRADLKVGDAAELPWPDGSFDLVLQSTVFTSILDPAMKEKTARDMVRVLKPKGIILWYDFMMNNPANPHVRRVGKREILGLFPGLNIKFQRITLAPPLTKMLAGVSWTGCLILEKLGILNTHYLAVLHKP